MIGRWGRGAAMALLATFCWMATLTAQTRAAESIAAGTNPAIDVRLGSGTVTVQSWDRPDVGVFSNGSLNVQHLPASQADQYIPKQMWIQRHRVATPQGQVTLRREQFVLPALRGSHHDAVLARGNGDTTIMVPRGTALVVAHVDNGGVTFNDYRGVFVAESHNGPIRFNNVNGSGFAESLQGPIEANGSTFDRLRARTATGDMMFRGCTSHQIQATSHWGSIVYDNGRFEPGLARFESEHGNVALGVRGGAQIGAQSGTGRVFSSFHNEAQVQHGASATQATVRGGGPVVTAASKNGSVFLYNGSVRAHPRIQQQLQASPGIPGAPAGGPPAYVPPPPPVPAQHRAGQNQGQGQGQGQHRGHRKPHNNQPPR